MTDPHKVVHACPLRAARINTSSGMQAATWQVDRYPQVVHCCGALLWAFCYCYSYIVQDLA